MDQLQISLNNGNSYLKAHWLCPMYPSDPNTIKVDNEMLAELDRLQQKFDSMPLLFSS